MKRNTRTILAAALLACSGAASAGVFTFDYTFGSVSIGFHGTTVHGEFTGDWDSTHSYVENVSFSSLSYLAPFGPGNTISGGPWSIVQYYSNSGPAGTQNVPSGMPPSGDPGRIYSFLGSNNFYVIDCTAINFVCTNLADQSVGFQLRQGTSVPDESGNLHIWNGAMWSHIAKDADHVNATWLLTDITPTAPTSVPEPGMLTLLGLGLASLGIARRRRTA